MSSRPPAQYGPWSSRSIRDPRLEFADKSDLTTVITIPDRTPVFVGTYSHIFRGYCRGHEVAIKVIRVVTKTLSSMRRKVTRERDVWGHLDHPNIVPLYGYTEPSALFGDFGAFISPWYKHGDAAKFLQDYGPSLTMGQRCMLWQGVITGVTYLHTHIPLIIHGDLKPGNILIDGEGNPRICDFGLCSIFIEDGHSGMTTTSEHAGTERYLAPELITSPDARPTAASDVYALGCIGLEFLFLQHPHSNLKSNRNGMIMLEIMKGTPPALRPPDLSEEIAPLWDALEACWQRTPIERISAASLFSMDVGGKRFLADMEAEPLAFQTDEKLGGQREVMAIESNSQILPSAPLSTILLSHRPSNPPTWPPFPFPPLFNGIDRGIAPRVIAPGRPFFEDPESINTTYSSNKQAQQSTGPNLPPLLGYLGITETKGEPALTTQLGRLQRRRYKENERRYICGWQGCTKAFGTLIYLNDHVSLHEHGPKRHASEFEPATHSQSTHPESLSSAPPRSPLPSVAISGEGYPVNKQVPSPLFGDSIGKTTWDNFEPLASWQAPPSLADLAGARIFTPTVDLPHNQSQSDFLPLPERPGPVLRTQQKGSKSYREIERRYTCRWNGCTKAYGTLNHLNDHVSLQGHGPKRRSSEFK